MKSEYDTRENDANNISGRMPFIELRLYNQLIAKMNALNCNAVFGIQVEMEVSCCAGLYFMSFTSFISYSLTLTHHIITHITSHHITQLTQLITSSLTSLTSSHHSPPPDRRLPPRRRDHRLRRVHPRSPRSRHPSHQIALPRLQLLLLLRAGFRTLLSSLLRHRTVSPRSRRAASPSSRPSRRSRRRTGKRPSRNRRSRRRSCDAATRRGSRSVVCCACRA